MKKKRNWYFSIICILAAFYGIAENMPFGVMFKELAHSKRKERYDGKDGAPGINGKPGDNGENGKNGKNGGNGGDTE